MVPYDRGATWRSATRLLLVAALAAAPSMPFAAQKGVSSKKLVCWTDDAGRRSCGDVVPPEYADTQRSVMDSQGRVTQTIRAPLTPEERAAQEAAARQAAEEQRLANQQAAYERSLLVTYARPEDIAAVRDDRLASIDASCGLTQKSIQRDQAALAEIQKSHPAGTPTDTATLGRITSYQGTLTENQKALASLMQSRASLCAQFDRDIRRFQELKYGQVTYESPCPTLEVATAGGSSVDLDAARSAFDGFAALHHSRLSELFLLYSDDAVIRYPYTSGTGSKETAELSRDDYRDETTLMWKALKPGTPGPSFTNIDVSPDKDGAAKVTATLQTSTGPGHQFWVVMRPISGQWRVIEQWSDGKF